MNIRHLTTLAVLAASSMLNAQAAPAPAPSPAPEPPKFSWTPGKGIKLALPNFEMNIGMRMQFRLANEGEEFCKGCYNTLATGTRTTAATGVIVPIVVSAGANYGNQVTGEKVRTTNLSMRRLKPYFGGWAFDPRFKYDVQFEASSNGGGVVMREAAVDLQFTPHAQVKLGQWKGPFGRQRVMSDGNGQFVDASLATDTFAMGFDTGVMLHGGAGGEKNDKFDYSVGVFSGKGVNNPVSSAGRSDNRLLYAARVVYMPFGGYPMAEGAVDNPDKFTMFVGASWNSNGAKTVSGSTTFDTTRDALGFEAGAKWRGFSFATECFHVKTKETDRTYSALATNTTPAVLNFTDRYDFKSRGYYLQLGAFAIPKKLEFAVRMGEVDRGDYDDDTVRELRVGMNYYLSGNHPHKVQFDIGTLKSKFNYACVDNGIACAPGVTTASDNRSVKQTQVRLQYQYWF